MKLSVSLPDEDVAFLDDYAQEQGLGSRSAALQQAVRSLRATGLGADYEGAWEEWEDGGHDADWAAATEDGLGR